MIYLILGIIAAVITGAILEETEADAEKMLTYLIYNVIKKEIKSHE